MPTLAAISKIDFPFKIEQEKVKTIAQELFAPSFPKIERMLNVFDNTEIKTRNLCKPIEHYSTIHSFGYIYLSGTHVRRRAQKKE